MWTVDSQAGLLQDGCSGAFTCGQYLTASRSRASRLSREPCAFSSWADRRHRPFLVLKVSRACPRMALAVSTLPRFCISCASATQVRLRSMSSMPSPMTAPTIAWQVATRGGCDLSAPSASCTSCQRKSATGDAEDSAACGASRHGQISKDANKICAHFHSSKQAKVRVSCMCWCMCHVHEC